MKFHLPTAEVFVPDGLPVEQALRRTSHLAIAAHQDDIEIMAARPILECFQQEALWFTGVVVTDGRKSPRAGLYEKYDDEQMRAVRFGEQRKAAMIGDYAAQIFLDYPSSAVKDGNNNQPVEDIATLVRAAKPRFIYTHNLADKHDTHVGVAMKVLAALRSLPEDLHPVKLFGCEVWRDLDWVVDSEKVAFDMTERQNLQEALLAVYDSQITGGKRYDLGSMARRRANATYFESHGVDKAEGLSFAMDLTLLIQNPGLDPIEYVQGYIQRFSDDVAARLKRVG